MNWKIRLKNPVFWVQVLTGAFATVLAYSGLTAESMTTWAGLWSVIVGAFSNPYCLFLVARTATCSHRKKRARTAGRCAA